MDVVAKNIKRIRKARGLLQKELADKADMNPSNLSKLERGEYTWTKENLGRIATALSVDLSALFAGEPKIPLIGYAKSDTPLPENWRVLNAIDDKLDRILAVIENQTGDDCRAEPPKPSHVMSEEDQRFLTQARRERLSVLVD